jgi:hypothetical protein
LKFAFFAAKKTWKILIFVEEPGRAGCETGDGRLPGNGFNSQLLQATLHATFVQRD